MARFAAPRAEAFFCGVASPQKNPSRSTAFPRAKHTARGRCVKSPPEAREVLTGGVWEVQRELFFQWMRWLWGSVRFRVEGSPERFFNQCARSAVALWGMESGETPGAWVRAGQYRSLLPCARRAHCRLRVVEKRGLPFQTYWLRRRKGLVAGAVLAAAILGVLSQQVWCIQAEGLETITPAQFQEACEELGLVPGAWKKDLDPHQLQQQLMLKFPHVSWLTVNTPGSVVRVSLAEGVEKPDVALWKQPGNVKAAFSGQILRLEVYAGTAQVNDGDAVTQGQLLISGVVEDSYGGVTLKHAAGRAIASTQRQFSAAVPMAKTVPVPTGRTLTRRSLQFFGLRIPLTLTGAPGSGWEKTAVNTRLRVNGTVLPISLLEEQYGEISQQEEILTPEEALAKARELVEEQKKQCKGLKVLEQEELFEESGGVLYYTVNAKCEEDIALETEILVN